MTENNFHRPSPIEIGKTVPIMEHTSCPGTSGTVIDIQPGLTIKIRCNSCLKVGVIIDTKARQK